VKPAIALAAVALTSLAACTTRRRVGDMEANRNRPVAHLTEAAIRNHEELFPGYVSKVKETDPELIGVFENFAFDEVLRHGDLDVKTRVMVILASTLGSQALGEYKVMLGAALNVGVTPVEAKEILYQAVPYVGMAKVLDFIHATNDVLTARGVALPLEGQSTTTPETRYERGLALQKEIFGDRIEQMDQAAPAGQRHVQHLLSANCFGDHWTRSGLDTRTRELLTFSMLAAMGGVEPQLKGHVQGNLNVGNDKERLVAVLTQLLPYIGYPRTLSALACVNEVTPDGRR
jgi:4-carboxymuconolactone decarboxylase